MEHTPGPWIAEDHGEVQSHRGRMVTIRDKRNIHLATVDGLDASVRGQESANARLIAAAPALLEALEAFLDIRPERNVGVAIARMEETCGKARDAIKQAKS